MDHKTVYSQLLASYPSLQETDYVLVTDGSGVHLAHGGAAFIIGKRVGNELLWISHGLVADTNSTVLEMELYAVLKALRTLSGLVTDFAEKVPILWYTDNESACLGACRDPNASLPLFSRDDIRTADLWAAFEVHERRFQIFPVLVGRNTFHYFSLVDALASESRCAFKQFDEICRLDGRFDFLSVPTPLPETT